MTHLVAEAVERYLAVEGWLDDLEPSDVLPANIVRGVFDPADKHMAA